MADEPIMNAKDRIPMVRAECKLRDNDVWKFIEKMTIDKIEEAIGSANTKRGIIRKIEAHVRRSSEFVDWQNEKRIKPNWGWRS